MMEPKLKRTLPTRSCTRPLSFRCLQCHRFTAAIDLKFRFARGHGVISRRLRCCGCIGARRVPP